MTKKLMALAIAATLGAGISAQALAQAKPETLVKQRQSAMVLQAKYLGPIGAMLKGNAPYNADIVARNATFLENLARMPWDGFDPSTKGEKSKAKPAVFDDSAKFKQAYEQLEEATAKLGAAARAKDEAGVKAAFGPVAKACGGCHDNFREK
ncbi:MAG TPA: cytochrome c [Burkholderiales bacterium]|jgi:cytochrome c556|nr:cytochrome c [Burkholderiales bacterium]